MDSRVTQLVVTTILVTFIFIGIRPPDLIKGIPEDQFWASKMFWNQQFDVVFAGDSRINRNVSPTIVQEVIASQDKEAPTYHMANFGFNACGLTSEYLDHVERLLAPDSQHKVIVLGITPLSLSPKSHKDNNYIRLKNMNAYDLYETKYIGPFLSHFRPMDLYTLLNGAHTGYFATNYPDGWTASTLIPEDPMTAIRNYQNYFVGNQVSQKMIETILEKVKSWRQKGIVVIGLFPPTTPQMRQLQHDKSGLNEAKLIEEFKQAGGIWLSFDESKYHSYDGSHLREDSAEQFSQDLAKEMQPYIKSQSKH